jgi:hypothetical protein
MKVRDLINVLQEYNQEAEISILFGGADGSSMETAENVLIEPNCSNNIREEVNDD